jgi:type II secretory pathway pseudopilin PulG
MPVRMRHRLGGNNELGVTVVEVLVVIILIGFLMAVAIPSYLGFRDRAANHAAKQHLQAALPSAQAYYANKRTYAGLDSAVLVTMDPRISPTLSVASAGKSSYCLTDTVDGKTWSVAGPGPSTNPTLVRYFDSVDCR